MIFIVSRQAYIRGHCFPSRSLRRTQTHDRYLLFFSPGRWGRGEGGRGWVPRSAFTGAQPPLAPTLAQSGPSLAGVEEDEGRGRKRRHERGSAWRSATLVTLPPTGETCFPPPPPRHPPTPSSVSLRWLWLPFFKPLSVSPGSLSST